MQGTYLRSVAYKYKIRMKSVKAISGTHFEKIEKLMLNIILSYMGV